MIYLGDQAVGLATSLPEFADIVKVECGSYTPVEDELAAEKNFPHSFGEIPDFLLFSNAEYDISAEDTSSYVLKGHIIKSNIVDYPYTAHISIALTSANKDQFNNVTGSDNIEKYFTDSNFHFPCLPSSTYLKAGLTYYYIIGKWKEVTPNA